MGANRVNDGKVDFSKLRVGSVLKVVKDIEWDASQRDLDWIDKDKKGYKALGVLSEDGKKIVIKKGWTIRFSSQSKQGIFDVCISSTRRWLVYLELVEPSNLDGFVEVVKY